MKGLLLVLGVLVVACLAQRYYQSYTLYGDDQAHLIMHPFNTKDKLEFTYVIEFPESSQYVMLMRTDAYYGEMPKKCDPSYSVSMWNMTLYNGMYNEKGSCKWERNDADHGSIIRCNGKIHFNDYVNKDYMFMLVNCNKMGLNGVYFEIFNYDKPMTGAASSISCFSAMLMTLAAVVFMF